MSIGSDIYVFLCMGFLLVELFDEWYILCAIDDYLRFMYGGKFRGFKLKHVMVGKFNFFIAIGFIWS